MSKIIPRETIDALRHQVDVTLDIYGIDATIYIPTNTSYEESEKNDIFKEESELTYLSYITQVFIEWGVSVYKLKKLGLYTEDMLPIVAWFPNSAVAREGSEAGSSVDIDIIKRSYFTISPEFIPSDYKGSESFEIVNPVIRGIHDAVILKGFSIVPRRI